jgi:RimJ/RimL family protein N-acetyltransferase
MSDTRLPDILLVSERLGLRPFAPEDASETFAAITPGFTRFMNREPPATPLAFAEVWRTWLPAMAAGTDLHFVIRLRSSGEFLGLAGLHGIDHAAPADTLDGTIVGSASRTKYTAAIYRIPAR